ncbi:hypothetical protein A3I42_00020 [Candidatus Uhrbacteria bacterium RIFCSPLOWO2_02_FULL_49_11]|uniref:Type II toxin-antitoxin system RelE/ParE family toxin n=1 Tax=Candidatus Uhrbacteria bacterium RIFCSPLOWO2_02_FULL_49_11 TaxID=1802409 RepID=A0A1F7VDA0_9BACT|nr:MAG: hypothetical protein A3I42_00020 [Candidatus Uhrbacteria bacterium RIFCSPLOWO2_02_FULL_49_11]
MDTIEKALARLSDKERGWVRTILLRLKEGRFSGLDVKKFKGNEEVYRIRKGDIRIIVRRHHGDFFILAIERRSEKTYRNY